MDALSEAIVRLLQRHERTERRIARIETALGIGEAAPPVERTRQPEPVPPPVASETQGEPPPQLQPAAPIAPRAPVSDRPREFETQVGLTWISRIGAVTLIFC